MTTSLFIEQGWTAKKLQTVIGHANIATTMDIYGHLFKNPEADSEAMKQFPGSNPPGRTIPAPMPTEVRETTWQP